MENPSRNIFTVVPPRSTPGKGKNPLAKMVRMAKMVPFSKTACHLTAVDGQHPAKKQFTFMLSGGESPIIRPATGFCSSNQENLWKVSQNGLKKHLGGAGIAICLDEMCRSRSPSLITASCNSLDFLAYILRSYEQMLKKSYLKLGQFMIFFLYFLYS